MCKVRLIFLRSATQYGGDVCKVDYYKAVGLCSASKFRQVQEQEILSMLLQKPVLNDFE